MGAERGGDRPTHAGLKVAEVKRKGSLGTVSLPPSEIQAVNGLEGVMAPSPIASGGIFILLMATVYIAVLPSICKVRPAARGLSQLPWLGSYMWPPLPVFVQALS